MNVTYYGHACFGVEIAGKHLLFDPFVRPNELAHAININRIPADYILISHGHADHVADAVDIASRTGATVVSNFEITEWLAKAGVKQVYAMNHGGNSRFDFGRVKYVNAIHSSSLPDGSYGGNPGGFVVETGDENFYYSGDTALSLDMKLLTEGCRLKLAILPIGGTFTMEVEDAVRAAEFVGCDQVMGVHYDTFPPIKIDHNVARELFAKAGKTLHLLTIGETRTFH